MRSCTFKLLLPLLLLSSVAQAENCVVNLSHYDAMRPDFGRMKDEGIMAVIHEASYPPYARDAQYYNRQMAAAQAGLLWGAYHFANSSDPVRQADHFVNVVRDSWLHAGPGRPREVLLVLDFERNGHYPGGTMRPDQAARFVERIRERTGKYPGIYGSENWIRAAFQRGRATTADLQTLTHCWLWIANYHYPPRYTSPWRQWDLWQYTGDGKCGLQPSREYPRSVANIRKAERNIFRGSRSALEDFWVDNAWQPGGATADR